MRAQNKYSKIKGWGIDADPDNDPTYPIKQRNNAEHEGYSWDRPSQQPIENEVLHSIERPNISAVYGTSTPPHGLSGWIRRMAFRYSESSYAHWLPLLLADRIDVIEGMLSDISRGKLPFYFKEKGYGALFRHNKKLFLRRAAPTLVLMSLGLAWLVRKGIALRTA